MATTARARTAASVAGLAAVGLLLLAPTTRAEERAWHFDAEALTDLPIHVGGQGTFEIPGRLRLSASVGIMPKGYVELINAIGTGAGWYNDATADVISAVLQNSLIIRPKLGWRPLPNRGFYFDLGYTLATLGGAVTGAELLALASGQEVPPEASSASYDADATLHMVGLELGWGWTVGKHLRLRTAIGGSFTVASHTDITQTGGATTLASRAFEQGMERYLDDVFQTYVHTVVITVALGWRMF